MIWWIVLAAVAALGAIPVGLYFAYDADGFRGRLILGPIRYTLFPQRKKEKEEETPESEQTAEKSGTPTDTGKSSTQTAPASETKAGGKDKTGRKLSGFSAPDSVGTGFSGGYAAEDPGKAAALAPGSGGG